MNNEKRKFILRVEIKLKESFTEILFSLSDLNTVDSFVVCKETTTLNNVIVLDHMLESACNLILSGFCRSLKKNMKIEIIDVSSIFKEFKKLIVGKGLFEIPVEAFYIGVEK